MIITCRRMVEVWDAKIDHGWLNSGALVNLGVWFRDSGRTEEAEELLRLSLTIYEVMLGPENVQVTVTLLELGRCAQELGQLQEAEELLRRCLAIEEAQLGAEDVQVGHTLHQLGIWAQEAGRLGEALLGNQSGQARPIIFGDGIHAAQTGRVRSRGREAAGGGGVVEALSGYQGGQSRTRGRCTSWVDAFERQGGLRKQRHC